MSHMGLRIWEKIALRLGTVPFLAQFRIVLGVEKMSVVSLTCFSRILSFNVIVTMVVMLISIIVVEKN